MRIARKHILIALFYFFMIACLGVSLRLFAVADVPANYKFLVHTHSHIALLGWVYTAMISVLTYIFCRDQLETLLYRRIFWFAQICIVGMLFTFPFTGYALFSIIFSTFFLIATYFFAWFFMKKTSKAQKERNSYKLIRAALWFMIISSIGPWSLGYIMTALGNTSPWYRNAIYFYLHFQYNGWFLIALIGIFFFLLEEKGIYLTKKFFHSFYYLLNGGVILSFFLSILWMKPGAVFYILAGIGGFSQLIAFFLLFRDLKHQKIAMAFPSRLLFLLKLIGVFLGVKLIAQFAGAFPAIAETVTVNIDLVISYLHWIFLGIISLGLLVVLNNYRLLKFSKSSFILYISGFFLTEFLIAYRGIGFRARLPAISDISLYIVLASVLLLLAVGKILFDQFLLLKKTK